MLVSLANLGPKMFNVTKINPNPNPNPKPNPNPNPNPNPHQVTKINGVVSDVKSG